MERYSGLFIGNAIGLGVARGLDDDEIVPELLDLITRYTTDAILPDAKRFTKSVRRARNRLHFLSDWKVPQM